MKKWFSVRMWIPVTLGILTLFPLVGGDMVYAAGAFGDSDALKGLAEIASVVINIFTFLALVVMNFFSDLIGTDFITGDQAMNAIKPMWIIVRNLVNVMFVVMLVFLAFSNLFSSIAGEGGGNWTIKDKLPKIIISLVAINFSLLGFRLIIDAIHVGTVAILGIADHKLEGEDQSALGGFKDERTWVKLSDEEANTISSKTSDFVVTDDVQSGNSCTTQYQRYVREHASFKGEIVVDVPDTTDNTGNKTYACRTFMAQINNTFCPEWKTYQKDGDLSAAGTQEEKDKINATRASKMETDNECMFMINPNKLASETILGAKNEPGQNLFMAFGTVFMHLEKLPALAAHLGSLDGVLLNTLFSALMSIMFLVALVAVFLALLGRVVVLWVALVFSPVIVAAKVMDLSGSAGDLENTIVTSIVMPLKIAAAFAVGFVMLSAMVTISPGMTGGESTFWFGAALSQMGQDEYSILWQIATVFLFWKAAKWSVEGNMAEFITSKIFEGAQSLGGAAARAATIDRPIFGAKTGEGKSLSTLLRLPEAVVAAQKSKMNQQYSDLYKGVQEALGFEDKNFGSKKELSQKLIDWKNDKIGGSIKLLAPAIEGLKTNQIALASNAKALLALPAFSNMNAQEKARLTKLSDNPAMFTQELGKFFDQTGKSYGDKIRNLSPKEESTTPEKQTTGGEGKKTVVEGKKIGAEGGTMYEASQLTGSEKRLEGVTITDDQFDKFAAANGKTSAQDKATLAKTMADEGAKFQNISKEKGTNAEGKSQGFFFTDRRGNYIDIGATLSGAANKGEVENIINNNVQASYGKMENEEDKTAVINKLNAVLATNPEKKFTVEPGGNGELTVKEG